MILTWHSCEHINFLRHMTSINEVVTNSTQTTPLTFFVWFTIYKWHIVHNVMCSYFFAMHWSTHNVLIIIQCMCVYTNFCVQKLRVKVKLHEEKKHIKQRSHPPTNRTQTKPNPIRPPFRWQVYTCIYTQSYLLYTNIINIASGLGACVCTVLV